MELSADFLSLGWGSVSMSYGKEDNLPINTYKCGGVLPKWQYLHLRR